MRASAIFLSFSTGLLGLLLLSGCADTSGPAIVEGKVSINGTPLNHGTLKLTSADGKSKTSPISPNGSYQVTDAPTGEVTATVEVNKAQLQAMQASKRTPPSPETSKVTLPPSDVSAPVPIDPKYSQPANGEKITVSPGRKQTINIDF